jgi:uncharacterized protein
MRPPFTFDPAKDAANRLKHGMSLAEFAGFDQPPVIQVDDRRDYGEARYRAFGLVGGLACSLAYAVRDGQIRLISLRRAHDREVKRHGG